MASGVSRMDGIKSYRDGYLEAVMLPSGLFTFCVKRGDYEPHESSGIILPTGMAFATPEDALEAAVYAADDSKSHWTATEAGRRAIVEADDCGITVPTKTNDAALKAVQSVLATRRKYTDNPEKRAAALTILAFCFADAYQSGRRGDDRVAWSHGKLWDEWDAGYDNRRHAAYRARQRVERNSMITGAITDNVVSAYCLRDKIRSLDPGIKCRVIGSAGNAVYWNTPLNFEVVRLAATSFCTHSFINSGERNDYLSYYSLREETVVWEP